MAPYAIATSEMCRDLLGHCASCYRATVKDPSRLHQLNVLAESVSDLESSVRGYERIEDPTVDTDDEILNWAFSETAADLCSAIWLLASGFYKASASSLRNAFDIAVASLYFQIRENTDPASGSYNRFFSDWDAGRRQTPNWGEMRPFIGAQPSVTRFRENTGLDILDEAYRHFKYLCSYTHTSAFANNGDPVTAINTTGTAPAFEEEFFVRGCSMVSRTSTWIALLWQITYPQIASTLPLGPLEVDSYRRLFPPPFGPLALGHR
ncbi:MAG: hypothetical protein ACR2IV_15515 [Bryobacteraceae bacterium]